MIVRSRREVRGGIERGLLASCVQEFMADMPRLFRLRDCYEGRHGILERRRSAGLPNERLVHDFPRYISTMASGYLVGRPVEYEIDGDDSALEEVLERYRRCAMDTVDAELARDASIYGRGVELVFADEEARPRAAALEPMEAFVVYDDTVERKPLFGVHLRERLGMMGEIIGWETVVYTECEQMTFSASNRGEIGSLKERTPHFFGGVPMVEYWNGEDERGDFEGVMTLIDAYDRLESDRVNDKSQFVDGLLLLYGCTMETDERGRTPGQQLREDKLLALPDSEARAEWLSKQLSEADAEVLKRALAEDIHKLSMVPDLSDAQFAGNQSGVAIRYKLLGLEQLTGVKERWFREALRCRLRLFANFLAVRGAPRLDAERVRMIFTRSILVDESED